MSDINVQKDPAEHCHLQAGPSAGHESMTLCLSSTSKTALQQDVAFKPPTTMLAKSTVLSCLVRNCSISAKVKSWASAIQQMVKHLSCAVVVSSVQ